MKNNVLLLKLRNLESEHENMFEHKDICEKSEHGRLIKKIYWTGTKNKRIQ